MILEKLSASHYYKKWSWSTYYIIMNIISPTGAFTVHCGRLSGGGGGGCYSARLTRNTSVCQVGLKIQGVQIEVCVNMMCGSNNSLLPLLLLLLPLLLLLIKRRTKRTSGLQWNEKDGRSLHAFIFSVCLYVRASE